MSARKSHQNARSEGRQKSPKKRKVVKEEISSDSVSNTDRKFTFFYSKDSPFSQHHISSFTILGLKYNCAEQYMMHQKAVVFKDDENADKIMKEKNPVNQKRLGRKVKSFDPHKWNSVCEKIVKEGNIAKFSQNPHLKKKLFDTTGTTLVEASPRDRKWGIGMGASNPKAKDPSQWRGKNLLGNILTEIREDLLAKQLDIQFDDDDDVDETGS